jgi:glycosyltransferase involved in cell wall biosynthesis
VRVAVTVEQCWHRVPGGTARATLGTAAALADLGPELGIEQIGVAARHRHPPPEAWTPPVPVRQLPLPRLALYEAWHRLRRPRVERATGPVDVVHATAHVASASVAPLVVTVHDLHFLHEPDHFTRRGVGVFRRFLDIARSEAAVVVCPSEATRADCVAAGLDPGRVRVVPWGVGPASTDAGAADEGARDALRARYGLTGEVVLFVGTVEPRKNLGRLVEAVGRLGRPGLQLALVGPDGWADPVADAPHVRRIGFVDAATLDALYGSADVVCYPSLREGFGLPVLEAMAQGAPVVTSAGTATAEVAGDAAVLVDPLDVDAIAGGIAAVLDDPARAAALRAAGPARAATYTWERTARAMAEAYRAALGPGEQRER